MAFVTASLREAAAEPVAATAASDEGVYETGLDPRLQGRRFQLVGQNIGRFACHEVDGRRT